MDESKLQRLLRIRVFQGMTPSALAPLLPDFVTRTFAQGERIWHQGDSATRFTFLSAGHAKLVRTSGEGEDTILGLFHPGDTLGHVTTYRSIPYPATAIAMTRAEVLEISQPRMFELMDAEPELMRVVIDDTTRRAHELVARIQELTSGTAEERLALVFVRLAEALARRRRGPCATTLAIPLVLSRRDLAGLVSVREETAIRIMSRWQASGMVETASDGFVVPDLDRLRALSAQR